MRSYIRGGLFDNPLPAVAAAEASTPQNEAVARQIAEQGSVLLKNDGALPLTAGAGKKIALFGPTASSTPTTVNGFPTSAVSVCSLTLRFRPTFPPGNTLPCEDVVSAETALTARAAQAGATVTWNNGQDVAAAAAQAATADVAVVFGYQRMGEFSDLTDLRLQGNGDALISAIEQANPNTVVVLQTGRPSRCRGSSGVQAVLENWYGGEQQGPAIASLLFGDVSPTGKLPMTFPVSLADTPTNTPSSTPARSPTGRRRGPRARRRSARSRTARGCRSGTSGTRSRASIRSSPSATGCRTRRSRTTRSRSRPSRRTVRRRSASRSGSPTPASGREPRSRRRTSTLPASTGAPGTRLVGWQAVTLQPASTRM